jgi:hypothetical protein
MASMSRAMLVVYIQKRRLRNYRHQKLIPRSPEPPNPDVSPSDMYMVYLVGKGFYAAAVPDRLFSTRIPTPTFSPVPMLILGPPFNPTSAYFRARSKPARSLFCTWVSTCLPRPIPPNAMVAGCGRCESCYFQGSQLKAIRRGIQE